MALTQVGQRRHLLSPTYYIDFKADTRAVQDVRAASNEVSCELNLHLCNDSHSPGRRADDDQAHLPRGPWAVHKLTDTVTGSANGISRGRYFCDVPSAADVLLFWMVALFHSRLGRHMPEGCLHHTTHFLRNAASAAVVGKVWPSNWGSLKMQSEIAKSIKQKLTESERSFSDRLQAQNAELQGRIQSGGAVNQEPGAESVVNNIAC